MTNFKWCDCPKCGHHLFRYLPEIVEESRVAFEVKCSSCKGLVTLVDADGEKRFSYEPRKDRK